MSFHKSSPSSIMDVESQVTGLKNWTSNFRPTPKKLERAFHYEAKNSSTKTCVSNANEECEGDDEGETFKSFENDWAKQDQARNIQLDHLEALEDLMETTMHLADQIVRLITKLKKSIKAY